MQAPQLLGYRRGVQPSSVDNVAASPARNVKQDSDYIEIGYSYLVLTSALIINQGSYTIGRSEPCGFSPGQQAK
jgi:hypothetical protein